MGRRRKKGKEIRRIESRKYVLGYAKPIRGQWVIFVSDRKFPTGLSDIDDNAPEVRARIDRAVEQVNSEREARKSGRGSAIGNAPSLYKAVDLWHAEHIDNNPRAGKKYRDVIHYAVKAYSPEGDDVRLEATLECAAVIARRMSEIRSGRKEKPGTAAQYLGVWKRIFTWCVAMGWLVRNPVDLLSTPTPQRKPDDKRQYSPKEFKGLLEMAQKEDPELFRLYRFLYRTGMRIQEALSMTLDDVSVYGMKIHGKGHGGAERIRYFPLRDYPDGSAVAEWQREIREILEVQRSIANGRSHVWRWQNRRPAVHIMERHKKALKIPTGDGRAFQTFRSMAEHHLQYDLGLPLGYCAVLLGHTVAVAESRYAIIATPDKMGKALDMITGHGPQPAPIDPKEAIDISRSDLESWTKSGQN